MLTFNYGSPYFWEKFELAKFISECRIAWDLICGTFISQKLKKLQEVKSLPFCPTDAAFFL